MNVLMIPFIIQGLLMFVDEFYFHEKRGLPKWERWGHPMDSLTVLLPYLVLLTSPFTEQSLWVYIGLCLFSCVFITKDEFIHQVECKPWEHWLHACLFVLHPITFGAAGFIWWQDSSSVLLKIQPVIISVFMLYQLFRWSFYVPTNR